MIRRSNVTRLTHIPGDLSETHSPQRPDDSSGDEEDPLPQTTPSTPQEIPCAISLPADQHEPEPDENDFSLGPSTSELVDLPSDHTKETQSLPSESQPAEAFSAPASAPRTLR